jgi:hypothetical protein
LLKLCILLIRWAKLNEAFHPKKKKRKRKKKGSMKHEKETKKPIKETNSLGGFMKACKSSEKVSNMFSNTHPNMA